MKRLVFGLIISLAWLSVYGQTDPLLKQRLNKFLEVTERLDLPEVLNYTYPKLFTLAPKDQMLEILKKTFDNEQVSIKLDSINIDKQYPVFQVQKGSYAKIVYSMKMIMLFKSGESDPEKQKQINKTILSGMQSKYGEKNVRMDDDGNILMHQVYTMVAVKDQYAKQWCFVNLKENDALTAKLFSKEIIGKLTAYK